MLKKNHLNYILSLIENPDCMNMQIFFHFINVTIRRDVSYFTAYHVQQRLWTRLFVKLVMSPKNPVVGGPTVLK